MKKIKELKPDGIIFVCGSFKYSTQDLYRNYSSIVWAAKKLGIPVMYDAMNIQKYSHNNVKCKILKKYANSKNVKVISSRDGEIGVNKLKEDYIYNKNIKLLPVGDPAFYISECYSISKENGDSIGVNVIRSNIFLDYGYDVSCDIVIELYVNIMKTLDKEGIKYRLFTNGLADDYNTACEIVLQYNKNNDSCISTEEIIVPKNDIDNVKIISKFAGIIGARLHANICAYALDIPLSSFIWDEKLKNFSICNHLESYFVDENNLNAEIIVKNLYKAIDCGYNKELRDEWKEKTFESIKYFISKL